MIIFKCPGPSVLLEAAVCCLVSASMAHVSVYKYDLSTFSTRWQRWLDALSSVYAYKNKKAKADQRTKHKDFLKQKDKQDTERQKRLKEERKKTFRAMGQKEKKKLKSSLKGASKDN